MRSLSDAYLELRAALRTHLEHEKDSKCWREVLEYVAARLPAFRGGGVLFGDNRSIHAIIVH